MVRAMSSIGTRIKTRRAELQLTQQQLAERVSQGRGGAITHQADISCWESGRSTPATPVIAPLAAALEVSADWLLTGRDDEGEAA